MTAAATSRIFAAIHRAKDAARITHEAQRVWHQAGPFGGHVWIFPADYDPREFDHATRAVPVAYVPQEEACPIR